MARNDAAVAVAHPRNAGGNRPNEIVIMHPTPAKRGGGGGRKTNPKAEKAMAAAKRAATVARAKLKEAPLQTVIGGAVGAFAAGYIDQSKPEGFMGGKIPTSAGVGVLAAGAAIYMGKSKYAPYLSGAAVGLITPMLYQQGVKMAQQRQNQQAA